MKASHIHIGFRDLNPVVKWFSNKLDYDESKT